MVVPYLNKLSIGHGIEKIDELSSFYQSLSNSAVHLDIEKSHGEAVARNRKGMSRKSK
jgi:hypothetical protein